MNNASINAHHCRVINPSWQKPVPRPESPDVAGISPCVSCGNWYKDEEYMRVPKEEEHRRGGGSLSYFASPLCDMCRHEPAIPSARRRIAGLRGAGNVRHLTEDGGNGTDKPLYFTSDEWDHHYKAQGGMCGICGAVGSSTPTISNHRGDQRKIGGRSFVRPGLRRTLMTLAEMRRSQESGSVLLFVDLDPVSMKTCGLLCEVCLYRAWVLRRDVEACLRVIRYLQQSKKTLYGKAKKRRAKPRQGAPADSENPDGAESGVAAEDHQDTGGLV